jgi:hypothetical protein
MIAERQLRVIPIARTIVNASTNSTADAAKVAVSSPADPVPVAVMMQQMLHRNEPSHNPRRRAYPSPWEMRKGHGQPGWLVLVYRVPSESSRARVAVWRDLKRIGALYLQQAVCILPRMGAAAEDLAKVRAKIQEFDGSYTWFEVDMLPEDQDAVVVERFRALAAKEYAEIVEECDTKFVKEIEFERFRENYTFEEAEEIRQDLEKIRRWLARVEERDWFDGPGRAEVLERIAVCAQLMDEFEEEVYRRTDGMDVSG